MGSGGPTATLVLGAHNKILAKLGSGMHKPGARPPATLVPGPPPRHPSAVIRPTVVHMTTVTEVSQSVSSSLSKRVSRSGRKFVGRLVSSLISQLDMYIHPTNIPEARVNAPHARAAL